MEQHQLQEKDKKGKQILNTELKDIFVAQTKTLSAVTRTIAGVVLGTIWAICYKENTVEIPNGWLLSCIIASIVYFLVELLHYTVDSIYYFTKSNYVVKSKGNFNLKDMNNRVQKHSKCSFVFMVLKASIVFLLGILFIIGLGKLA